MLDENLPTFYLRSSNDGVKHNASVLLSHQGSDATPAYSLRHPDPALPASKNRYAVALYDSYIPDVLYGEVLLIPTWTHPTPTKEEIRLNNGLPPPPQPMQPAEFVIQLYNPDQQVTVKMHAGSWSSAPYWEFGMPQESFRRPSNSILDRTQSDPTASDNTPKLCFRWKKDGKLSKDYVCSLSGKSTNPDGSKRKNREPDITIALFKHFKEITIYEPNLSRVDMEDPKGLEVVLLLGAIVIREVYNSSMRETFNISESARMPASISNDSALQSSSEIMTPPRRQHRHHSSAPAHAPPDPNMQPKLEGPTSQPPPTDPRTQWELDAETVRLRKAVKAEEHQRRKTEEAETKRVKRMLEEEERKAREKQKEVDRETERLKQLYGREDRQGQKHSRHTKSPVQPSRPGFQPSSQNHAVTSYPPQPIQRPQSASSPYLASNLRPLQYQSGPYLQAPGGTANSTSVGTSGKSSSAIFEGSAPSERPTIVPKKSNFWGVRRSPEEERRLTKQRSTVF